VSLPLDSTSTIIDCLEHYARIRGDERAYIFLSDGETEEMELSYADLQRRSQALASELRKYGLSGQTVLLLYPAGLDFVIAFFACLYAGATAVPANLARNSRHFIRLRNIMQDSACRAILTQAALQEPIATNLAGAGINLNQVVILTENTEHATDVPETPDPIDPSGVAFIQYTSGSTGNPKGVVVTHAQLIANERAIQRSANLPEFMTGAGWLPQFHDMGLIGNLLQPLAIGGTYIFMSPLHFIQSPLRWMRMLSRYQAHASAAPCFALEMCVQATSDAPQEQWDLSALDTIFCGAEPIRQDVLDAFHRALAPFGLRDDVVKPCYGMAETTLMITGGLPHHAPRSLSVDRQQLTRGLARQLSDEALTQAIVCCGQPVRDHRILIVCPQHHTVCEDDTVGEIWCAGPSIASGYWRNSDESKRTFAAFTADGEGPFLRTGDLGFRHQDGIFVTGRIKEVMILRGRNYYPHDMEATVTEVFQQNRVRVQAAVFAERKSVGNSGVIAFVELPRRMAGATLEQLQQLLPLVRQRISQEHDLSLKDTLLLKHGSIPRTSSGKIQRLLCSELYQSGAIQALAAV